MNGYYEKSQQQGYTLIEMMVALAVTSIVLTGTYAAYTFFARQQQVLTTRSEISRSVLTVIDLMKSDIRAAGFTAEDALTQIDKPIDVEPSSGFVTVFDEIDSGYQSTGRVAIRYCLDAESNRLLRDQASCCTPQAKCIGEPVIGGVKEFTFKELNNKNGKTQTVLVTLKVESQKKIEGASPVVRTYSFVERARNVSLVP